MIKDLQDAIKYAREKAEELRERAYSDFDSWTDRGKALATECLECAAEHDQLADLLTELAERREADGWIPVSERLPNRNGVYAVTTTSGYTTASYFDGKDNWHDSNGVNFGAPFMNDWITHWQPLSEPYKESEDK